MQEKVKAVQEFFNSANEFLHGTDSRFKMAILAILLLVAVLLGVLEIAERIKEKNERLKAMEAKHPSVFKFIYSAKMRCILLVIIVILLCIDWRDSTTMGFLVVKITPPPFPQVVCTQERAVISTQKPSTAKPATTSPLPTQAPVFTPPSRAILTPPASQPFPGLSAYHEVDSARQDLRRLQSDWKMEIVLPPSLARHLYGHVTEEEKTQARKDIAERDRKIDRDDTERFEKLSPEIDKAHSDAIERMSLSGPKQLTPNDIKKDNERYTAAVNTAKNGPTLEDLMANKLDEKRFEPLILYLDDLYTRLGDYNQGP